MESLQFNSHLRWSDRREEPKRSKESHAKHSREWKANEDLVNALCSFTWERREISFLLTRCWSTLLCFCYFKQGERKSSLEDLMAEPIYFWIPFLCFSLGIHSISFLSERSLHNGWNSTSSDHHLSSCQFLFLGSWKRGEDAHPLLCLGSTIGTDLFSTCQSFSSSSNSNHYWAGSTAFHPFFIHINIIATVISSLLFTLESHSSGD